MYMIGSIIVSLFAIIYLAYSFKWWYKLFKSSDPKIGELWGYEIENPFEKPILVRVISIKKGYIQFERFPGGIDSARLDSFIKVYHKLTDDAALEYTVKLRVKSIGLIS